MLISIPLLILQMWIPACFIMCFLAAVIAFLIIENWTLVGDLNTQAEQIRPQESIISSQILGLMNHVSTYNTHDWTPNSTAKTNHKTHIDGPKKKSAKKNQIRNFKSCMQF